MSIPRSSVRLFFPALVAIPATMLGCDEDTPNGIGELTDISSGRDTSGDLAEIDPGDVLDLGDTSLPDAGDVAELADVADTTADANPDADADDDASEDSFDTADTSDAADTETADASDGSDAGDSDVADSSDASDSGDIAADADATDISLDGTDTSDVSADTDAAETSDASETSDTTDAADEISDAGSDLDVEEGSALDLLRQAFLDACQTHQLQCPASAIDCSEAAADAFLLPYLDDSDDCLAARASQQVSQALAGWEEYSYAGDAYCYSNADEPGFADYVAYARACGSGWGEAQDAVVESIESYCGIKANACDESESGCQDGLIGFLRDSIDYGCEAEAAAVANCFAENGSRYVYEYYGYEYCYLTAPDCADENAANRECEYGG